MALKNEKPQLSGFSGSMANHWPPKGPCSFESAGGKVRFAAGPDRTWALLAGSRRRTKPVGRVPCVAGCGTYCSSRAVLNVTYYQLVSFFSGGAVSGLWKPGPGNDSGIHRKLPLTVGTVVSSTPTYDEPANGGGTHQTRLASAEVDPVLQLEKTCDTVRIHVVRH
jgi:hypothetical protein